MLNKTMNSNIKKLVFAAILAALVFTTTFFVHFPVPGAAFAYLNAGDALVYMSALLPGGVYGAAAAGLGSMIADLFSGAAVYAPATLIIKFMMSIVCAAIIRRRSAGNMKYIFGAILGGLVMVLGYFVFELIMFDISYALAALIGNCIQFAFGVAAGCFLLIITKHLPERLIH